MLDGERFFDCRPFGYFVHPPRDCYVGPTPIKAKPYVSFAPAYAVLAVELAKQISGHATPVSSGTVACTKRISIERYAVTATIAWMRHQATAYEDMIIPRVKGQHREIRKQLVKRPKQLLNDYRNGAERPQSCPLAAALKADWR